jgi:Flp pilus assembly protein TadD
VFRFLRRSMSWKQHFEEGMAHGQASDFAKAEASFREAVRLAPTEPYPHYELGYTLFLLERYDEALQEFRRTDELLRGFFLVQTEAYLCEEILAGRIAAEVLGSLRLLQRFTDGGAAQAQSEEAVFVSRTVVESAPECALGHYYLGKALLNADPLAAEAALQRCVALRPDDTTAIDAKFHLGVLRYQTGQKAEARRIWRGILADYPGNPHVKVADINLGQGERSGT